MRSTIDQKIERCLQALSISDPEHLFNNMRVIEGYIDRKPIFLEWLHPEIKISSDGVPTQFSRVLKGEQVDTVKLWFLALRALWGDMRLQGSRFLDCQQFDNVHFTSVFSEAFELEWLRLPKRVHSFIPSADVCWLSDDQIVRVDQARWENSHWAVSLNGKPDGSVLSSSVHLDKVSKRASRIIGVDGHKVSEEMFIQWCRHLKNAPVLWLALPSDFSRWDDLPNWSKTLVTLQATGIPSIAESAGSRWIGQHSGLMHLYLRNAELKSLPPTVATLTKLEVLDCSGNPLSALPDWLSGLSSLKTLNVAGTRLEKYPKIIEQIMHLEQLVIRNHNAQQTLKWLKRLEHCTNLTVKRLINPAVPDLWTVCLNQYLLDNPEDCFTP